MWESKIRKLCSSATTHQPSESLGTARSASATLRFVYRQTVLHAFLTPLPDETAPFLAAFAATTATKAFVVGPTGLKLPIGADFQLGRRGTYSSLRVTWLGHTSSARVVHTLGSDDVIEAARWARQLKVPFAVTVLDGWQPANEAQAAALQSAVLVVANTRDHLDKLGVDESIGRVIDLTQSSVSDARGARAADLDEQWKTLAEKGRPAPQRVPTYGTPTVAVVMVTYNRRELLLQALLALEQQDYPRELLDICIVDNACTDGSAQLLDEWTSRLPLQTIHCPEHIPVAEARNRAVAQTVGEIVAFTDDDCRPSERWIRNLVQGFSTGVGLVQGQTAADDLGKRVTALSRTQRTPAEAGLYETCNIAYRREVLPGVGAGGPFDLQFADLVAKTLGPRFARYPFGEDTEMAWRVKGAGSASRFSNDAVVFHHVFPPDVSYLLRRSLLTAAFPVLMARLPTLKRSLLTGGFLLGRRRIRWWLALAGVAAVWVSPLTLLAVLPYLSVMLMPMRPGRMDRIASFPVLVARDLIETVALIYGSVRARCLVL